MQLSLIQLKKTLNNVTAKYAYSSQSCQFGSVFHSAVLNSEQSREAKEVTSNCSAYKEVVRLQNVMNDLINNISYSSGAKEVSGISTNEDELGKEENSGKC